MLRKLKNLVFRLRRLTHVRRMFRDIDNYLANVAIQTGLPEVLPRRALVLSPHPDDESIGCGGAIHLLSRQGVAVDILFLSCGDQTRSVAENHPTTRYAEAQKAAQILGATVLAPWDAPDGGLHHHIKALAERLNQTLDLADYGLVFCPWPYDGHSDHAATFKIFQLAARHRKYTPQTLLYETWSPVVANRVVNIDAAIDTKLKAIREHKSQIAQIDYAEKVRALAQYRSLICRPSHHAEAYFETAGTQLFDLATADKRAA